MTIYKNQERVKPQSATLKSVKWQTMVSLIGLGLGLVILGLLVIKRTEGTIELDGDQVVSLHGRRTLRNSIILRGRSRLVIEDATLSFELTNDLGAGIYLEDQAVLIVTNATITSNRTMYEIELRGQSKLQATRAELLNHSAVKLFDTAQAEAADSILEEVRMDDRAVARLVRTEIYPNLQFSASPRGPLKFPSTEQPVTTMISLPDRWQLELFESTVQGWQVDVYPGTTMTVQDSTDVTLGLRSDGRSTATLNLENPADERTNFHLTELGFDLTVTDSEIYFVNFYPRGTDRISVNGTPGRTRLLEVVLSDDSQLTLQNVHLMAQLAHANDRSEFMIRNSTVGSDDPTDPINSELAATDEAQIVIESSDAQNANLLVTDTATLTLRDTQHDSQRVHRRDDGRIVVE